MDVDQPKQTAAFQELGRKASAIYERHYPESFARLERSVHEEILPDWRMHGMVYTSAIVNKNNMLTYHRDAANYAGMWSAMYAYSGPAGGQLVIPELGVAFAFQTPTLIFFDGQRWLHGVAPVRRTSSIQRRYSVVFYCMRALRGCLSGPEELKRIRQVREQRERDRLHARVPAFMAPGKGKVPASVAIVSTGHLNIPDALWDEYGPRADWIALSTKAPRSKVPWGMTKHTATRRPDGKVDHWSLSITEQTASLLQRYESVLLVFSRKHAECFAAVRRILPRDTQAIEIK